MNHRLKTLNELASMLGGLGILGLGILAFSSAFFFSTLQPTRYELERFRAEAARLDRKRPPTIDEDPGYSREALGAFYAFFPASNRLSGELRKIYQAAERHAVQLEQAEYRVAHDSATKLVRYQISLPLKGTYTQVRKFLAAALSEIPHLALESVQFERQRVGDTALEARVMLVMFLGTES